MKEVLVESVSGLEPRVVAEVAVGEEVSSGVLFSEEEVGVLMAAWPEILRGLSIKMPLARMYLKLSSIVRVVGGTVYVGLHPRHESAIGKLEQKAHLEQIEGALNVQLGVAVHAAFEVLSEVPEDPDELAEVAAAEVVLLPPEERRGFRDWHDDPVVRRTLEVFHGDIIDVTKG